MLARGGLAGSILILALMLVLVLAALRGGDVLGAAAEHSVWLGVLAAVVAAAAALVPSARGPDTRGADPTASLDDMVGMLDDALKLARTPPDAAEAGPLDVAELVAEAAAAGEAGARVRVAGVAGPLQTYASRAALARVFEILIDNALASGTRAAVWCDRGLSAVLVHVDDDGPGVARTARERVFEWRYYMTTPPSERTGCSAELVIARRIARTWGGEITVGASPLGGGRFSVRLPLLAAAEAPERALAAGG